MKRIFRVAALAASLALTPHTANAIGAGIILGSDNGVSIGISPWDIGIAVDDFKLNVDHRWSGREFHPNLYYGLGASISDKDGEQFGVRAKAGMTTRIDQVELFAELVPNLTFGDNGDFDFDFGIGMRLWF